MLPGLDVRQIVDFVLRWRAWRRRRQDENAGRGHELFMVLRKPPELDAGWTQMKEPGVTEKCSSARFVTGELNE
jgi:hypothetical protein